MEAIVDDEHGTAPVELIRLDDSQCQHHCGVGLLLMSVL
jgi:hypothetical protein